MRFVRLITVLFLLFIATRSPALDASTRLVGPIRTWTAADLNTFAATWLHVKFVEGSGIQLENGLFLSGDGRAEIEVNEVVGDAEMLRRSFQGGAAHFANLKAEGQVRSGRVGPDLSLWFDVRIAGGPAELAAAINALNALPEVEIAHPSPVVEPAVLKYDVLDKVIASGERDYFTTPDFTSQQHYLGSPPIGLDAAAIWAHPGGRGEGMKFIDVELGWVKDHEDFTSANFFHQGQAPMDPDYYDHGTAVLGEIVGADNGYGVTGFAADALWGVVPITVYEWPEVSHRFQEALDNLDAGDVWLIELQMVPPGRDVTPMEWLQINYDVIWTSSWSRGVVCVEAGANGGQNLDAAIWNGVFDRTQRDSGAIMVAAGTPYGRVAESWSNYGSRMDVHAWGSEIVTTGYGDLHDGGSLQTEYTEEFNGTSGASPMVVGAALCLQGFANERWGAPLTPLVLRNLLSSTGTPHLDPVREIGPRPDLGMAVSEVMGATAVDETPVRAIAELVQNHPNPFNPSTEITLVLFEAATVDLTVYDAGGHRVANLLSQTDFAAGPHAITWSGRNDQNVPLPSGIYLYELRVGDIRFCRRMTLLK
ncbi:MAG: S8 family serine peptidase [bacterium]|nr:S8 family serine peptidase [bacterium]